ncbi:MAG TPA: flavin-nucleotide-binding protein [Candidatus Wallbacteria bacterium]|nr:flavin-nucleotide-binding protein [Candidatus Wallbacteria bacterium]
MEVEPDSRLNSVCINFEDKIFMAKYHMNKPNLEITDAAALGGLIRRSKYMSVAMCSKDGSPYIVTLSCGYDEANNRFYFHCSKKGHKLDIISENPAVCATIIEDGGYVKNDCIHLYRTAVIWGKMTAVDDASEKIRAFEILFAHLEDEPEKMKACFIKDGESYAGVCVLRLDVEKIDCKSNIKI